MVELVLYTKRNQNSLINTEHRDIEPHMKVSFVICIWNLKPISFQSTLACKLTLPYTANSVLQLIYFLLCACFLICYKNVLSLWLNLISHLSQLDCYFSWNCSVVFIYDTIEFSSIPGCVRFVRNSSVTNFIFKTFWYCLKYTFDCGL